MMDMAESALAFSFLLFPACWVRVFALGISAGFGVVMVMPGRRLRQVITEAFMGSNMTFLMITAFYVDS